MEIPASLERLPAFTALEIAPVLLGHRPGASVQLDYTYLDGCREVLQALGDGANNLQQKFSDSHEGVSCVGETVERRVDSIEEGSLLDVSQTVEEAVSTLPVVDLFDAAFPGRVVATPEWNRLGEALDFGVRVYFFPDGEGPDAQTIYRRNISAVVEDDPAAFERYQGGIHGYPECCIETFLDRSEDAPERRAVEAMAGHLLVDDLPGPRTSLDEVLPGFCDDPDGDQYSWFAREFFPTPGCENARKRGRKVVEALKEWVPSTLVHDYVRVNYLYGVGVASRLGQPDATRPGIDTLGHEGVLMALPLGGLSSIERYQ